MTDETQDRNPGDIPKVPETKGDGYVAVKGQPQDVTFRSMEVAVKLGRTQSRVNVEASILAATNELANALYNSWSGDRRSLTASFTVRLEEY